jgi:curved DNA-binding protein CbpA
MAGSPPADVDPFDLLGVPENASDKAIKAAWRRLIRECHPDNAADDADRQARLARSAALNRARDVLLDPDLRADASFRRRWGFSTPADGAAEGQVGAEPQGSESVSDSVPGGRARGVLAMLADAAFALLRSPVLVMLCLAAVLATNLTTPSLPTTGTAVILLLLAIAAYALLNEPSDTSD